MALPEPPKRVGSRENNRWHFILFANSMRRRHKDLSVELRHWQSNWDRHGTKARSTETSPGIYMGVMSRSPILKDLQIHDYHKFLLFPVMIYIHSDNYGCENLIETQYSKTSNICINKQKETLNRFAFFSFPHLSSSWHSGRSTRQCLRLRLWWSPKWINSDDRLAFYKARI